MLCRQAAAAAPWWRRMHGFLPAGRSWRRSIGVSDILVTDCSSRRRPGLAMSAPPKCCRAQRPALAPGARPHIRGPCGKLMKPAAAPCIQRNRDRRQRAGAASGRRLLRPVAAAAGQQGNPLDLEPVSKMCGAIMQRCHADATCWLLCTCIPSRPLLVPVCSPLQLPLPGRRPLFWLAFTSRRLRACGSCWMRLGPPRWVAAADGVWTPSGCVAHHGELQSLLGMRAPCC